MLLTLMSMKPKEFFVDSDNGGHVVGLTHRPSRFQFHIPRADVPSPNFFHPAFDDEDISKPPIGRQANAELKNGLDADPMDETFDKVASIAVDLDGTLAMHEEKGTFDPAHVGKPVPAMLKQVKAWLREGKEICIFTARAATPENIPVVEAWLKKHGLEGCKITNEKTPDMEAFYDDRAVRVDYNEGTFDKVASVALDLDHSTVEKAHSLLAAGLEVIGYTKLAANSRDIGVVREFLDNNGLAEVRINNEEFNIREAFYPPEEVKAAYDRSELKKKIHRAGKDADRNPTLPQIEAGNYAKGHVRFHGLDITIENPRGSMRRGVGRDGKPWSIQMRNPYGYIKRTTGKDGENVDVFIGDHPDSEIVFVIDQCQDNRFDEHKVMLGCVSREEAEQTYLQNYTKDWICGEATALTMPQFRAWLRTGEKNKPLAGQALSTFVKKAGVEKDAVVRKKGKRWYLYTKDRKRVLGRHSSKRKAYLQEYAIQKSQERAKKASVEYFPRPENYEKIDEYSNANMDVAAGGMDWHSGWSHVGIHLPGKVDEPPECWFEISHDNCPHCKGTNEAIGEPMRQCMQWSKSVVRKLMRLAANSKAFKNGDWAEFNVEDDDALENIGDYQRVGESVKSASAVPAPPTTGPAAIAHRLAQMNLDAMEEEQRALIRSGKVSKRSKAVKLLNIIEGLRRNELTPDKLMINQVPVIPAIFRPFAVAGSTFIPGDANELYRDLFTVRDLYKESRTELGETGAGEARHALYKATKALFGYGEPVNPKTAGRGVTGFFSKITGTNPKFGWLQRKMLSKPQDNVSRGTITINPDLGLDEIGMPEEMAWKNYSAFVQRRLVRSGFSPDEAVLAIRDKTPRALLALQKEIEERPAVYSRAPAWHKFNTIAGRVRLAHNNIYSTPSE